MTVLASYLLIPILTRVKQQDVYKRGSAGFPYLLLLTSIRKPKTSTMAASNSAPTGALTKTNFQPDKLHDGSFLYTQANFKEVRNLMSNTMFESYRSFKMKTSSQFEDLDIRRSAANRGVLHRQSRTEHEVEEDWENALKEYQNAQIINSLNDITILRHAPSKFPTPWYGIFV
jgi:hypothetical protein